MLPYLSSAWNIDGSHLYRLDLHPHSIYHNIPFHSTYFRNCPDASNACIGRKGEKFFYKNNEADHWLNMTYPDHYHLHGRLDSANITSIKKINEKDKRSGNNYDQSEFFKESGGIGVGYYSHPSSSSSTCTLSRWTSLKSRSDIPINPLIPYLGPRADSSTTYCDTTSSNAEYQRFSKTNGDKIFKVEDGECGIRYPYAMKTSSRIFRNGKNIHHQHHKNYRNRDIVQPNVAFGRNIERDQSIKCQWNATASDGTNRNYKRGKKKEPNANKSESTIVNNSVGLPTATGC